MRMIPEHPNNHVIEEQDILARQLSYLQIMLLMKMHVSILIHCMT